MDEKRTLGSPGFLEYQVLTVALRLLPKDLMIAVFLILGLVVVGLGIGLVATARAPLGYQDETGFHLGQKEGVFAGEKLSYRVPEPKLA